MKREDFRIDGSHAYRLIDVLDREGEKSKVHTRELYEERVGAVATNLRTVNAYEGDSFYLNMDFVRTADGRRTSMYLSTSSVETVEETEGLLKIVTRNSVYVLEPAELPEPKYLNEKELLELYVSVEADDLFCGGVYYDKDGKPIELKGIEHTGTFTDSFLIGLPEEGERGKFLCRYYVGWDTMEFYSIECYRMVLHNEGTVPIKIRIGQHTTWIIQPGETKRLSKRGEKQDV